MATNIDFKDEEIKRSLERYEDKYEHNAEKEASEGNETERQLSGQLILLTTVLITANILVLGDGNIATSIKNNSYYFVLIFSALIFEILATYFGIMNYRGIENKYDENATIWANCVKIVTGRKYKTEDELESKLNTELSKIIERNKISLRLQIVFILVALVMYALLIFSAFHTKKSCPVSHKSAPPMSSCKSQTS